MLKKISSLLILLTLSACSGQDTAKKSIVKISAEGAMCSGEQIEAPSGAKYILSAAHCKHLADAKGIYTVTTEDGRKLNRKFVAEDPNSDLLLIEGVPNLPALSIGGHTFQGERVRTLTHGENMKTFETQGMLIQLDLIQAELSPVLNEADEAECNKPKTIIIDDMWGGKSCLLNVYEMISTAAVFPGSSGGAVLDKHDELVGVVSVGKPAGLSGFVLLTDIHNFLRNY